MRVLLIHNPTAGTTDNDVNELIRQIARAGHQVDHCADLSMCEALLAAGPDLIAVMGGDGTVRHLVHRVAVPGVPIAILPGGTANNIATRLGLFGVPHEDLIASWPDGITHQFDVGVAQGPWGTFRFLESVGAGLLSDAISTIDEGWASHVNAIEDRDRRLAAAIDVFRTTLERMTPSAFDVTVDGETLSGQYLVVEAMNFGAAGPNLLLSPSADYRDGLLDVVLVSEDDRHRLLEQMSASSPRACPPLVVHQGRRVQVRCRGCSWHLDDELWAAPDTVTVDIGIEAAALTFLTVR